MAFSKTSLVLTLLLAGCMVGPDFRPPPIPHPKKYIQDPAPAKTIRISEAGTAGKTQYFDYTQTLPANWWRMFHSPQINALVRCGLQKNPTLAAAKAALIQAQQNYFAQLGSLFPSVTGNFSAERERFSTTTFGTSNIGRMSTNVFNLFNANINVAYTLDVFGGLRRQLEAVGAQVDYQRFELEAAFLTLSSNIVSTAINIASLKAQIKVTQQLIYLQTRTLTILRQQYQLGGIAGAQVFLQESLVAQTRAALPPLQENLSRNLHILSTLVGDLPQEDKFLNIDLNKLHLPKDLPLSCPSSLVKQRPDIQAAIAQLHAASAQVGVATANMYPQITLNGTWGYQANHLRNLFQPHNYVWDIMGSVSQPIFKGGTLIALKRAAVAAFEQSAAQYKQTVLQAFQNVADSLRALEYDAQLLKVQIAAETAAQRSLTIAQGQLRLGGNTYLELLTAQRNLQQAQLGRIQAQAARYLDTVALFQALGGGWWQRCSVNCSPLLRDNFKQYERYYAGLHFEYL